eukprot:1220670-Pyramimonas_sp.AAC.1
MLETKISDPRSEDEGSSLLDGCLGPRAATRVIDDRRGSVLDPRIAMPRSSNPSAAIRGSTIAEDRLLDF